MGYIIRYEYCQYIVKRVLEIAISSRSCKFALKIRKKQTNKQSKNSIQSQITYYAISRFVCFYAMLLCLLLFFFSYFFEGFYLPQHVCTFSQ